MNRRGHDPGRKTKDDAALEALQLETNADSSAEQADPASYRDLTKEEILERIAKGYKSALAGEYRPVQELLDELDD